MPRQSRTVNILMYHSISDGVGPTCIPPATFRRQMAALADCGYHIISLATLAAWIRGDCQLDSRAIAITFDDGYADFATVAFPTLEARGWQATVFLPAGRLGATDAWQAHRGQAFAQSLMTWKTVRELAHVGVEFGGHGVTHADLTALPLNMARAEIVNAQRMIEDHTGYPVTSFAPPYGKTSRAIRAEIGRRYVLSVGTEMALARRTSDVYNLPRIEMWYFRDERRWRAYLEGGAGGYFLLRKLLRKVRTLAKGEYWAPSLQKGAVKHQRP